MSQSLASIIQDLRQVFTPIIVKMASFRVEKMIGLRNVALFIILNLANVILILVQTAAKDVLMSPREQLIKSTSATVAAAAAA